MKNISKGRLDLVSGEIKTIQSQLKEDKDFLSWVVCDKCRFAGFYYNKTTDCYNHFRQTCDIFMINLTYDYKLRVALQEQIEFNPLLFTRIRCSHCRFCYKERSCRITRGNCNWRCDIEKSNYTRN